MFGRIFAGSGSLPPLQVHRIVVLHWSIYLSGLDTGMNLASEAPQRWRFMTWYEYSKAFKVWRWLDF